GWGAQRFAQAIEMLAKDPGLPIALIGSKGDAAVAEEIISMTKAPVISFVGKTNLKQLASLLRRSRLHLCGDTGSAHIAAALGTRVVSLFGRSNPERLAPYGQADFVVHRRERCSVECRRFHDIAPINSRQ